jgi:hypothetical protein
MPFTQERSTFDGVGQDEVLADRLRLRLIRSCRVSAEPSPCEPAICTPSSSLALGEMKDRCAASAADATTAAVYVVHDWAAVVAACGGKGGHGKSLLRLGRHARLQQEQQRRREMARRDTAAPATTASAAAAATTEGGHVIAGAAATAEGLVRVRGAGASDSDIAEGEEAEEEEEEEAARARTEATRAAERLAAQMERAERAQRQRYVDEISLAARQGLALLAAQAATKAA